MAELVKFVVKDLNMSLLREELEAIGISEFGLLMAGFNSRPEERYEPFASRQVIARRDTPTGVVEESADPGELRFRFDPVLSAAEETALDSVLVVHDATGFSSAQINRKADRDAVAPLVANFKNWGALNSPAKDNNHKQLTRLVARLLDRSEDI